MTPREAPHEAELRRIVRGSDRLMGILEAVRGCDSPGWLVGGVLYKLVWNRLRGYPETAHVEDMDVVFFAPDALGLKREQAVERDLRVRRPDVPWEAKNQDAVHLWYEGKFGHAVPPLRSSEEGIAANPGTATAVGVRLLADDGLYVAAPLGLDDLLGMVMRRNSRRVAPEAFRQWVLKKGVRERWPGVRVIHDDPVSA